MTKTLETRTLTLSATDWHLLHEAAKGNAVVLEALDRMQAAPAPEPTYTASNMATVALWYANAEDQSISLLDAMIPVVPVIDAAWERLPDHARDALAFETEFLPVAAPMARRGFSAEAIRSHVLDLMAEIDRIGSLS